MTVEHNDALDFAERLRRAEREGTAAPLATETFAGLDWGDARRIALARDELRRDDGDICIGYKLGWTSAAMRRALGIERPNWGTLWRSQRIGRHLDLARLRHAKVEPEIVYVASSQLCGDDVSAGDVIDNASGWAVGIEVVHPRWESYDFTWLDNTADNSSATAVVLGPVRRLDVELSSVEVTFSNDDATRTGRGDQAMGAPAEAVAWLVRELAAEDRWIDAGQIVFTGGLTAPFDVTNGSCFTAHSPDLGTVEVVTAVSPERSRPWPE